MNPQNPPVTWVYKLCLLFVMAVTVICLIAAIFLKGEENRETADNLWKAFFWGFGAFIGLIGGKQLP